MLNFPNITNLFGLGAFLLLSGIVFAIIAFNIFKFEKVQVGNRKLAKRLSFVLIIIGIILIGLFFAFSSTQEATATPESEQTQDVIPTETVVTPTSTSTSTPSPTSTPTFTMTPSSNFYPNSELDDYIDNFGVPMRLVPEGEYVMGTNQWWDEEKPAHPVYISDFYIDKYEVTNEAFANFLNIHVDEIEFGENLRLGGHDIYTLNCTWCDNWEDRIVFIDGKFSVVKGFEMHPVSLTSWYGADTFCNWRDARLPTEAEWEISARGAEERFFPWGDEFNCSNGNFDDETIRDEDVITGGPDCDGFAETTAVGTFPSGISPFGIYDLSGNVWEWVADWMDEDYYTKSPVENPLGPSTGDEKVYRGGSWSSGEYGLRSTLRASTSPESTKNYLGFRCVSPAP